jgi:hypothetical protein
MFNIQNLQINRGIGTSNAQGTSQVAIVHTYKDPLSTIAAIRIYFPDYLNQGSNQDLMYVGDYFVVEGSDTSIFAQVLSLAPFTLGANLFEASVAFSIGAPVAATDGNALTFAANTLRTEIADQTHPGIVTAVAQDFGGVKTFHENVLITEPTNGLIIQKATGSIGVEIITSDTTSMNGVVFQFTGAPNSLFGMVFSQQGFLTANPELFLVAGAGGSGTTGIVLNSANKTATFTDTLLTDTVTEKTTANGVVVNGINMKPTTITFQNTNVYIDDGIVDPNKIIFNFAASPDRLYYDKIMGGLTYVAGGTGIFTIFSAACEIAPPLHLVSGLRFSLNPDPDQSLIEDYSEKAFTTTFTNNTETTGDINFTLVRVGKLVTIKSRNDGTAAAQAAPSEEFTSNTNLPSNFIPANGVFGYWRVQNNGVFKGALVEVDNAGQIHIHNDSDGTSAFTALVPIGFDKGSISYTLE